MQDNTVVRFLTEKPKRDAAEDAGFEERFNKNIGPKFREVDADIRECGHSEYLLKGGRGSLKSSFISMMIVKLLREEPRGSALVLRKVAATMRDTVFAQILWALDTLGAWCIIPAALTRRPSPIQTPRLLFPPFHVMMYRKF